MKNRILLLLLITISLVSCRKEFDKFERPDWLEGKLYTQLKTVPGIDSFIVAIEKSGYDTILDFSGSYTIFAPENEAFRSFMSGKYTSIGDIPHEDILELVKYHIIQNPWSRVQLQSLDVNGWIDRRDQYNNEPWGYKRQTLLKDGNRKYFIIIEREIATIVDSTNSNSNRTVFSSSRKYVPLFFDEYMSIADVRSDDFADFFGRAYEPGEIFFGNARLYKEDYFAENGFIYKVDQVVNPLKNVEQILENQEDENSYSTFLNAIYLFPQFSENTVETNKQPGASMGLDVPTLYNLDYNSLVFDIHEELTGRDAVDPVSTLRYHYGIIAPTNDAMQELIDDVVTASSGFPHWPSYGTTPENVKRIIVNSHMSKNPVYLSDIKGGFINGEDDSIYIDQDNIVDKIYGSNATFYGTNKAIVPRAFSSVAGPVYLRPGYQTFMYAVEYTNILPAIKRRNANYSFFVLPDTYLEYDSSLSISPNISNPRNLDVSSFDRSDYPPKSTRRNKYDLTFQMLGQVGEWVPKKIARKEFIKNLAGNFIVYNSENHPETGGPTVTGGVVSNFGYQGDSTIYVSPTELEEDIDNGVTYEVNGWLYFPRLTFFGAFESTRFFELIHDAGFVDDVYNKFNFINESEYYTVFLPTDSALNNYNTDTLTTEELQQFIKYHFIRGELIFTDGNKLSREYETLRLDESSTVFNTEYSMLDIRPSPDLIELYNVDGGHITDIFENDSTTNMMTAVNLSTNGAYDNYVTNGVIHEIDTVLLKR